MDFEIRGIRTPQGRIKPTGEREEHFRLRTGACPVPPRMTCTATPHARGGPNGRGRPVWAGRSTVVRAIVGVVRIHL